MIQEITSYTPMVDTYVGSILTVVTESGKHDADVTNTFSVIGPLFGGITLFTLLLVASVLTILQITNKNARNFKTSTWKLILWDNFFTLYRCFCLQFNRTATTIMQRLLWAKFYFMVLITFYHYSALF